jgi:hypothetical protein
MTPSEQLDWLLVGEGQKHGLSAIAGDGVFYEIWESMPPNHLDDNATLTLNDGGNVQELGSYKTVDAAKQAAEKHRAEGN